LIEFRKMTLLLKRILIILLLGISFITAHAQTMDLYLTFKRYYDVNEHKNYIELAYLIPGNLVKYKELPNNEWQAEVLIVLDVKNKYNEILYKHSYIIQSPLYKGEVQSLANLSDAIYLPVHEDSLSLLIQALDLNDSTNYFTDNIPFFTLDKQNQFISDISLIAQKTQGLDGDLFYKGGHILLPKFINYYPTEVNTLAFYVEAYQTDTVKPGLLKYFISDENNVVLDKYSSFKKLEATSWDALYAEMDISKLPSGNYYMYVEYRDTENKIVDRKRMFFQRMNKNEEQDNFDKLELAVVKNNFSKKYDLRNITHHIKALIPIAQDFEVASIQGAINSNNLELMQNFFYGFWSKREAKNPELAWKTYAEKVQFVDEEFGNSLLEGHASARGKIYLRYGKPFERLERNTAEYGRIELWTYEALNNQGNVQFLFVENPSFDDEFQLVHSNLNNEIFNKEWAQILKTNNF
jgi:GWxTD domain-containing protein